MVPNTQHNDEVTLTDLLLPVQRFLKDMGRPILILSLLVALLVTIAVALKPKYEATGLLNAPDLTLNEWRSVQPILPDQTLVNAYLSANQAQIGHALAETLRKQLTLDSYWENHTKFLTTLQRSDIKTVPNAQVANIDTLGIEISLNAPSEENGLLWLGTLAGYIRETMLWISLKGFVLSYTQENERKRTEIDAELVKQDFLIEQGQQRIAEMKRLLTVYPDSRRLETNSVISVEGGGGKFLSPIAQLIALETTISDANNAKRTAARNLEKLDWQRKYANITADSFNKFHSGSALYAFLVDSHKQIFEQETQSSAAREEYYDITMKLTSLRQRADMFVFKSSPKVSENPIRSRNPFFMGPVAFVASFGFFAMALYLLRKKFTATQDDWDAAKDPLFGRLPGAMRRWLFGR